MGDKFESKGRVCVTGASGFVASWLIKRLLFSGYHVTGTVRDPEISPPPLSKVHDGARISFWKAPKLDRNVHAGGAKERLWLARADLMEEGSFDDAIMGCDGVFHSASPAEILTPEIEGTLNVLRSWKKNPLLKRVVLTSSLSTARARDDFDPRIPLDESSWSSVELCERLKTLAERAAREFCNENKIDLVTVLPSFVVGPSMSPELCTTASDVLGLLQGFVKLAKLSSLENLDLSDDYFNDSILSTLGGLTSLKSLYLGYNGLTRGNYPC
ncbi:hypothetical protein RHMOL_Rhmol05G0051800 [Rhododendron molle]|uniref:Uncharacterized protein n=1 Tax=Rhododendron molle TaxID=49168 RepID=A0ACC0NLX9_RHOML|nr:hypothetical protein RHMOL_Rhmol05G0051800 [Rhododendron molle]